MTDVLMPKATAVWLVDNTSLTFEQIADFCGLHPLEVRGIADGEVARDIRGADPIANGQLSREELDLAEKNANHKLVALKSRHAEYLKPDKKAKDDKRKGIVEPEGPTLLPASETGVVDASFDDEPEDTDLDNVFQDDDELADDEA